MTQAEIVAHLAEKNGLKRAQVKGMLDALAALAVSEVKTSGEFTLPGIGKVVTAHREKRTGRNPKTGETMEIDAKTVVKFRAAKGLKDAVAQ